MSVHILPSGKLYIWGNNTCDVLSDASGKVYHVTAELDAGFLYYVKLPLDYWHTP
jgi:hypothetical protein